MLLFRSEEGIREWCANRGEPPGAVMSLDQTWRLSQAWYGNRCDPGFHGRTKEEAEAVFASVGLDGPFWRFA